ncbi:IS3 family transposase [Methylobacterium sp. D48H]
MLGAIQALIADLPTYGYRRVHALLRRQAERDGRLAPNAKRVYRVMKVHGLLLQRHVGGAETRRHEGKVAVATRNTRWAGPRPVSDRVGCPLLGRAGDRGRER